MGTNFLIECRVRGPQPPRGVKSSTARKLDAAGDVKQLEDGTVLPASATNPSDPQRVALLLQDFRASPSRRAGEDALRELVGMGSPILDVLRVGEVRIQGGKWYYWDTIAEFINEIYSQNRAVSEGLAAAVADPAAQYAAVKICAQLTHPLPVLIDSLTAALSNDDVRVRERVVHTLSRMDRRVCGPQSNDPEACAQLLGGLALAARDPEFEVAVRALEAASLIGRPSLALRDSMVCVLDRSSSLTLSELAIIILKKMGLFDLPTVVALRKVAATVCGAADLLAAIPLETLLPPTAESPVALGPDDERILSWFDRVAMTDYLTRLQVFWCIGRVDRQAFESAGLAMGWKRLSKALADLRPAFAGIELPVGTTFLRGTCLPHLNTLFRGGLFAANAWTEAERDMPLRDESGYLNRDGGRWTAKAESAWRYVDRFLTIKEWLPEFTAGQIDQQASGGA